MSVENMGNGYVKVGVKQEDLEAREAARIKSRTRYFKHLRHNHYRRAIWR